MHWKLKITSAELEWAQSAAAVTDIGIQQNGAVRLGPGTAQVSGR